MPLAILRAAAAAVALASVAAPGGEACAQGQGLRIERSLGAAPSGRSDELPTFVTADRIEGLGSAEVEAAGDVELRRGDTSIRADRIRYFQETDEAEALGNVRIRVGDDQATGPRLRLRLGDTTGIFEEPKFLLAPRTVRSRLKRGLPVGAILTAQPGQSALLVETEGRGEAKAFRFEGEERYRVTDGTFTTCRPGQDDWFISARELDLDFERQVGTARDARLSFLGLTTPNIPWFDFSLNNERKTGFLPPTAGYQNKTGFEFLQPFYWNIAPNYDATIAARYMSQRGLQFLNEFRFLQPYFQGQARYDILPNDSQTHTSRWAQLLTSSFNYQNGWTGLINYQKVSDDNYFRDLSPRIAIATQSYLTQQALATYTSPAGWWSAGANYQRFQTLQDPQNPVPVPYFREPQLTLNVLRQTLGGLDAGLQAEYVNFGNAALVPTGSRATAYPSLAWPNVTSYGFFTPKVGVSATVYDLDTLGAFPDKTPSRVLPIASVDSGLYFEREARWFGSEYLQTLEPRAYYLYVPFRDQTNLPIFDTTTTDFNYSQLYQENIFVGGDRIANASQLSLGAVSRLIRPGDGQEMVRAVIGQRYYFVDQKVFIPGQPVRTSNVSPLIVGLAGRVAPNWTADVGAQYQFADPSGFARFTSGVRYSPAPASVVSVAYRYVNQNYTAGAGTIQSVDVAAQWPLGRGFYGVGRYSYDLAGSKPVDTLVGLEYNAGCWILRAVAQKFQTSTTQSTTLFFLQLEFNGLARVGSDPLEVLRRSIPGYTLINQATPDPALRDFGPGSGVTGPVDVNSRVQPIRSDTPSTYRSYE